MKERIPTLSGVKVFDNNSNPDWYKSMNENNEGLSVFIPGHNLVTGILLGASGAYSNMACLNPFAAQKWYNLTQTDMESALELEGRIKIFMQELIEPLITINHFPNHACDRFMAILGGWADIGVNLRWPYKSIPEQYVRKIKLKAQELIPEFFVNNP